MEPVLTAQNAQCWLRAAPSRVTTTNPSSKPLNQSSQTLTSFATSVSIIFFPDKNYKDKDKNEHWLCGVFWSLGRAAVKSGNILESKSILNHSYL